jgi:hypothetical protein
MSITSDDRELARRIAGRGREVMLERLRSAFAHQTATQPISDVDPVRLEDLVQRAADRAGSALWLRSLAQGAMDELDLDLADAIRHPAVAQAQELVGAPAYPLPEPAPAPEPEPPEAPEAPEAAEEPEEPEPLQEPPAAEPEPLPDTTQVVDVPTPAPAPPLAEPQALRLAAVHLSGIETLRQGDRDIELRLSEAGLDVLKRSNGAAIGRLEWREIETVQVPPPKRGLRGRRRGRELHVSTGRGQAQFELPGLTDTELREHLEPTLNRLHGDATVNS